jgi:hypothetical protein
MTLRKSIVFIGSVLLLAACDRATAPTGPLQLHEGTAAAAKKDTARAGARAPSALTSECGFVKTGGSEGDSTRVCVEIE